MFLVFDHSLSSASSMAIRGLAKEDRARMAHSRAPRVLMHQNVSINGVVNAMWMLRKTQARLKFSPNRD